MQEMGDSVGVCLHYQTADDVAMEIAEDEIENKGSKKKKELLVAQFKRDLGLTD